MHLRALSTLQFRFLLSTLVISLVPLVALGIYAYVSETETIEQFVIEKAQSDLSRYGAKISSVLGAIDGDLMTLAAVPPVQGIVRARQGNGYDAEGDSSDVQWIARLQEIFTGFSRTRPWYQQIRYIDETGQELVRVDSDGESPRIVPKGELQNKKTRYYFEKTVQLRPGGRFVSPADLNRERGKIEVPHRPVARYAIPVHDVGGVGRGIVIINVSLDFLLPALMTQKISVGREMFLTDQDGFFLHHPDETKEWGSPRDLDTGIGLKQAFPRDFVTQVLSGTSGHKSEIDGRMVFYQPIFPDVNNKEQFWVLMLAYPRELLLQSTIRFRNVFVGSVVVMGVVVILLSFAVSHFFTKPILALGAAAKDVAGGDLTRRVKRTSSDEVGDLCDVFNKMTVNLNMAMEKAKKSAAVAADAAAGEKQRAEALQIERKNLEKAQDAGLNIMADMRRQGKEVEAARDYVQSIIASMADTLLVVNPDGTVRTANQATVDLLGYPERELLGKPVARLFAGEQAFDTERLQKLLETKSRKDAELTYKTKTGEWIPVGISGSVIRDGEEVQAIILIGRDVRPFKELAQVEKKRAEEAQRTYEEIQVKTLDLERFQRIAVGRELDMVKLKEEVNGLLEKMGEPQRYKIR